MLKRFFLALAFAGLLSPAYSAGTIQFSLMQNLDSLGRPLANCYFYTIQAGTTSTPQSAYQDSALTIELPNPQRCDASGRLPQFFLADGSIKVRLTSSTGVVQVAADGILVIGASSGSGGGSSVDATTVLATGDLKARYGTGTLDGFVRANGRTIGSASSGATERANADCQVLFEYLWQTDANLSVSTGRGVSSSADWAANKTIALPDWRGRALAFLDDMGSTAAGRLTSTYFGATATALGAAGGSEYHQMLLANVPVGIQVSGSNAISVTNSGTITSTGNNSITASGVNSISASGSNSISVLSSLTDIVRRGAATAYTTVASPGSGAYGFNTNSPSDTQVSSSGSNNISVSNASQSISVANASQAISVSAASGSVTSTGTNTITATSTNTGGSNVPIVSPMMLATIYVKL